MDRSHVVEYRNPGEDLRAGKRRAGASPRVLIVAPSMRVLGGQAVQADLIVRNARAEGARIDLLPINPVPWGPLRYLTRIKYLRTLIVSFFYLISLFWRVPRYDVIHIFSASYTSFLLAPTPAVLVARLFGKGTIRTTTLVKPTIT